MAVYCRTITSLMLPTIGNMLLSPDFFQMFLSTVPPLGGYKTAPCGAGHRFGAGIDVLVLYSLCYPFSTPVLVTYNNNGHLQ
jgi:hypothetical protein